jgi:hypothetical protein
MYKTGTLLQIKTSGKSKSPCSFGSDISIKENKLKQDTNIW